MRTAFLAALVACATFSCAEFSFAQSPLRLGVAGDSFSNEYFESSAPYAKSWTELVVQNRPIDLGPTAAQAGVGDWHDLRGWGYQNNYARPGSTTDALVKEGSPAFLAQAVAERGVTHVVVCASGNDMAPWNSFVYLDFYYDSFSQRRIDNWADMSIANVREAVNTIHQSGAKIVLVNMPDFGSTGQVQGNFPDPAGRLRATYVVRRVNEGLRVIARDFQIPLVDFFSLYSAIYGPADAPSSSLDIGGVPIRTRAYGSATDPLTGFVDDGLHPSTVVQALLANVIIAGLNAGYNTGIAPFTEAEILGFVGVNALTEGELPSQIGPYSQYVRTSFVCPADFNNDGYQNVQDIFDYVNAWLSGNLVADFDHSGTLESADVFAFLNAWMSGGC